MSDKDRRQYLGGKGVALKLLNDNMIPGINALAPENILFFMTDPATETSAPTSGRFAVVSKVHSPIFLLHPMPGEDLV